MKPFLDASALVKRYVREPGSTAVRAMLRRTRPLVARIAYAEVAAAIAKAWRHGIIAEERRAAILSKLAGDFGDFDVIEIRRATLQDVPALVTRHPLRGYDAVQLAAALAARDAGTAVSFWCTDEALAAAADAEGLRVIVPSD